MITITPATPGDVPQVLAFVRALAAYERAPDQVVATPDDLRDALFGVPPAAEVVIARVDGVPVGFALYFHTFSTWLARRGLWLEDLYVEPHARGSGVGRALLAHLARIAVERGCGRMEWSVLDWNAPAIGFYRALGARPLDEWTTWRLTGDALRTAADGGSASGGRG